MSRCAISSSAGAASTNARRGLRVANEACLARALEIEVNGCRLPQPAANDFSIIQIKQSQI